MATVDNYKIKVTVDGQQQVEKLNDSLDGLQTTLNRTAAAGVAAFTALAVSAARMADGIVDLADATGLSVGKIYQLSTALEAAGGQFDSGGRMLLAFSQSLGDIEKGSEQAIDALTKLGLSRKEIENLSDEQLFNRVVQGLAGMENGFDKTRIATELFGKSAAGVDFKKLADGLNQAVDPDVERNLRLAADAIGQIEVAFRNLQLVALQAIAPILEEISKFELSAEDARKTIQVLGSLIAGAFAASTVIAIAKAVQAIRALGAAIKAAAVAQTLLTGLIPVVGAATVIAAIGGATAAYLALGKAMEGAVDAQDKLDGTAPGQPGATTATGGKKRTVGETPEQKAAAKALATLQAQTAEMKTQNSAAIEYEKIINGTIGLSQEIADIKKIDAQLEQDRAKSAANYEKQIAVLKSDTSKNNQAQITELQKQQQLADQQLVSMAQLKKDAIDKAFAERQTTVEMQKQLSLIQQQTQQNIASAEAETMRRVVAGEITQEEAKNINAINRLKEEGLSKEKQLQEQIANEKDTLRKQELQNQLNATKKATDFAISEKQREIDEKSALEQSYAAGAVQAITQIADSLKPYKMAQDAIAQTWGKIGSAVDQFVETGKFKFSDFARSVIQDLAKMIIKAQIFKAIQATLGLFGFSIPGLATGGPAQAGQPYIVGEKGPELFVPKSAGTVIPNNKLSASTEAMATGAVNAPVTNNYITNNISALDAKSVAQLFAENRKTLLGVTETARREMAYA
jgi:lambda family phage tail tape measure protein